MSENNIDRMQEPDAFDVFLSFATEVRKTNLYKDFKHRMMREVKDWREEYYNFYCRWQDDKNSENIKSEAIAWWLLFTDKEYHRNGQFELLNDLEDYITNNGVRIDVVRYSEWIKWLNNSLEQLKQTAQTINKDACLLKVFNNDEAVYDKFFEQCMGKKDIEVINILLAILEILYGEKGWRANLKENKLYLKSIHSKLYEKQLVRNAYSTFYRDLDVNNKTNTFERRTEINNVKAEYKKLLLQKL